MKNPSKIVEGTFAFGTIQNYDEIYQAVDFIIKQDISNFLEIGTNQGGTFYAWICASNPGIRISIDIPHGEFGTDNFDEQKRNSILSGYPGECYFISGNSQDPLNLVKVEQYLKDKKLDFLFIDGDHTEEGVTRDFFLYKPFNSINLSSLVISLTTFTSSFFTKSKTPFNLSLFTPIIPPI